MLVGLAGRKEPALEEWLQRLPRDLFGEGGEFFGVSAPVAMSSTALGVVTAPVTGTAGAWVFGIASLGFGAADLAGAC